MVVKQAEKKQKKNPFLPVIGLAIAIALGVIAYFSAPFLLDLLADNSEKIALQIKDPAYKRNMTFIIAFIIWLVTLSFMVAVVASVSSKNIVEDEYKNLQPREYDPKAIAKYEKQAAQNRQEQIKAVKKLAKKQEHEKKRRG
jgi:hypothetical protein